MIELLKNLRQRWNDWCGDRDMELAIRKHLSENGFFGGTAKLQNVRLVAVQRPGWLQVFRFEATARLRVDDSQGQGMEDRGPDPEPQYQRRYQPRTISSATRRHGCKGERWLEASERATP